MSSRSGGLPRPALADVTNHTRKRALEGYGGKASDGGKDEVEDLRDSKQACLRLENLGMESNYEKNLYKKNLSPCLTDKVRKYSVVGLNVAGEAEGGVAVDYLKVTAGIVEATNAPHHVIEMDVVSRNSCCSVPLITLGTDSCNADSGSGVILQENAVRASISASPRETSLHGDCQISDKDVTVAHFNLDQSKSSESAKSVKPSKIQSFELERCTSSKGDNSSSSAADMLKTCSCSFCLKAAYIWSDLHYQDVKGRISAAKKGKKEAVNLFQRICMDKEANPLSQGKSDRTTYLESELSSQWKSLFLHMEESFARESNYLQDNFLALKDLRENCKVNLEMIDAKPADHD